MKITFLGTGPSLGTPIPTCNCDTCSSKDPRDARLRSSVYIERGESSFIIDCGPDFRQQVLTNGIKKIDFVLVTHQHNDHVGGMDDIRSFNYAKRGNMPIFGNRETLDELKKKYYYSFQENTQQSMPRFELKPVTKGKNFTVEGIEIMPIEAFHDMLPVLGFRIDNFTYLTDVKYIADEQLELVKGTEYLVINALRPVKTHFKHVNLPEALEIIEKINPKEAYLTHLGHEFRRHKELGKLVPKGVKFAYDGLQIDTKEA